MQEHEAVDLVKQVLTARFELGIGADAIPDDEPLFEAGLGLDSMAAIELVVGVEDAFGVTIRDEDLTLAHFATVRSLARLALARKPVIEGAAKEIH